MKRCLLAAVVLSQATAHAAPTPDAGRLTETSGALEFSGGPFIAPNLTSDEFFPQDLPLVCMQEAMNCDNYALSVNIAEAFRSSESSSNQVIRFSLNIQAQMEPLILGPAFDIYLFDSNGAERAHSEYSFSGTAFESFDLPLGDVPDGDYTVTVAGYNGMGASYTARVEKIETARVVSVSKAATRFGGAFDLTLLSMLWLVTCLSIKCGRPR